MLWTRRNWLWAGAAGISAGGLARASYAAESMSAEPLKITDLRVTPIALPDPPLLAASGCHGPYFLRNIVELVVDGGLIGIGETTGGARTTDALEQARQLVVGQDVFAYRRFARQLSKAAYAGIELACLDACGKATGRRVCELLGGPVRNDVEFAAYLFYRYAADDPRLLADPRVSDDRGSGGRALDAYSEIRTAETMARLAEQFRDQFGFRVFKLKGGVLPPDVELETMRLLRQRLGEHALLRIDPNARWKPATAVRIGQQLAELSLEYFEDPVEGQAAMAEVRKLTGLPTSTNMCVTQFEHIPAALELHPVDVVLCDHHYWGGMAGCLALGPISDVAGWELSQHSNSHSGVTMAAMIHLAASLPQLTLASDTHYPWLVEKADVIVGGKLPIRDGRMQIPQSPGLGVDLDRDQLSRAHETYRRSGMTQRDDAGTMRLVEPAWRSELL